MHPRQWPTVGQTNRAGEAATYSALSAKGQHLGAWYPCTLRCSLIGSSKKTWLDMGDSVGLGIDRNEDVHTSQLTKGLQELGLYSAVLIGCGRQRVTRCRCFGAHRVSYTCAKTWLVPCFDTYIVLSCWRKVIRRYERRPDFIHDWSVYHTNKSWWWETNSWCSICVFCGKQKYHTLQSHQYIE